MKTILIAEGDDHLARLFADLFTLEGWTVAPYNAGQPAVDALAGSAPYDAVLVNNRLHGMSGVELITRIRALAVGFVYSFSRLSTVFSAFVIAFFLDRLGVAGVFALIAASMVMVVLAIGIFGPKTRNLSLEAISC